MIAVEPELAGDLAEGFAAGERTAWSRELTGRTIADGLRSTTVGELPWAHIEALVDDVVTVSEESIVAAMSDHRRQGTIGLELLDQSGRKVSRMSQVSVGGRTSTVAPSSLVPRILVEGAVSGITTVAAIPASRAARARPRPWLPAE